MNIVILDAGRRSRWRREFLWHLDEAAGCHVLSEEALRLEDEAGRIGRAAVAEARQLWGRAIVA